MLQRWFLYFGAHLSLSNTRGKAAQTRTALCGIARRVCWVAATSGKSVLDVLDALCFVRVGEPVLAHEEVVAESDRAWRLQARCQRFFLGDVTSRDVPPAMNIFGTERGDMAVVLGIVVVVVVVEVCSVQLRFRVVEWRELAKWELRGLIGLEYDYSKDLGTRVCEQSNRMRRTSVTLSSR